MIVLTQFKMEITKIRHIIWTLDPLNLTPDRLRVLLKHLPTETEVRDSRKTSISLTSQRYL